MALMLEEDCTIDEAKEMLEDDEGDELKIVVYDPHRKGFYQSDEKACGRGVF